VGYEKRRAGGHWTALYELRPNVYRSAGTYESRDLAEQAWREKERELRLGNFVDPAKGRWTFRRYVEESFLPLHTAVKVNTRAGYTSICRYSLEPFFGDMELKDIYPAHVRLWVQRCQGQGLSATTIRTYKATLSTILSTAVQDRCIAINPALGVKTPRPAPARIRAISPEAVPRILDQLPGAVARMLVELALHSGLRWGELTELRGKDVKEDEHDECRVYLDVQRAAVDAGSHRTADGGRFHVEDTTKGGYDRRVGLSVAMTDQLLEYLERHHIGDEDLLFPRSRLQAEWRAANPRRARPTLDDVPAGLAPAVSATGRRYEHGTANAYDIARCRCQWCRLAKATQRAARRAAGKDRAAVGHSRRGKNITDHCPDDWFRRDVWLPALSAAGFSRRVVFYDLRHSHATWLARSRTVDLMTLKERMGHRSIVTTQRYLSASEEVDHSAADALEAYRAGAEQRAVGRRRRRIKAV